MVSSINFFETPYISVILLDIFWVKVKVQVEKVCQNTFFLIPTIPKIKIHFEIILWPFSSAPYGTFKPDFYNKLVAQSIIENPHNNQRKLCPRGAFGKSAEDWE